MRYSTSIFVAVILSFFTFLGMSLLISAPKNQRTKQFDSINFSMTDEMSAPDMSNPKPIRKVPKQETIKKPPAAPALDISTEISNPEISLPNGKVAINDLDLEKLDFKNLAGSGDGLNKDTGLMLLAMIQPIYPADALKNKIEGWVKVEFTVNEYGKVINAKVVDAQPKRIFDSVTLRAISKSKFKPLIVDGKAVAQTAVQIIDFKLK